MLAVEIANVRIMGLLFTEGYQRLESSIESIERYKSKFSEVMSVSSIEIFDLDENIGLEVTR